MPLSWAPGWQRNQVVRRAARILALQRELEQCTPDQLRVQELARRMMEAVAEQARTSWSVPVALRQASVRHLNLNERTESVETGWHVAVFHVGAPSVGPGPCVHPRPEGATDVACSEAPNLLDEPTYWTNPEAHETLKLAVGLHGMACWPNLVGPWQVHDAEHHAVHRAAMAAFLCEKAYNETMTWDNPHILHGGVRRNPVGMLHAMLGIDSPEARENSIEHRFVKPWRERFEALLADPQEIEAREGPPIPWRFLLKGEKHWTLELCWAVVRESRRVRLDCPPQVVPLHVLRERGSRTIEQALVQYLVDDPSGPRMKAVNAASVLGKDGDSVREMLRQARMRHPVPDPEPGEDLWDPLVHRNALLMPMAVRDQIPRGTRRTGARRKPGPADAGTGGE